MIPAHQCEDISDSVPLFPAKGLFFKPISRIHVSVHYPQLKQSLPTGGKTVSSWEIMEKLKALLAPDKFISIRVVKNTLEFIRFEGDLENRNVMKAIMGRLEGKSIKITGFKEPMKVRVAEAKIPFPTKYDWDSFFRDAKNMNEMKPGERPDTIHLQNLPCKWFSDRPTDEKPIPSEKLFRRIWEIFGDIRSVDIPLADPYRTQMQSSIAGIKTFTFSSDAVFEAYVQYRDYMNFVRAMDALRGCYILHQDNNSKNWVANVKVDFDKSKHLGEESIRRRRSERERLIDKEKQEKISATLSRLEENEKTRREIEEKKKESDKNQAKLDYKIEMEERKYVIARRKLEAIRLMDFLFERLKKKLKDSKKLKRKDKDSEIHEKIMGKYKQLQQAKVDEQHKKLKKFHKSKKRDPSQHDRSGDDTYNEKSGSRSRSRSRSRSSGRSRSGSRYSNRSRGHSRSRSRGGSRSRSRSRSREGSRSRSRSHSESRRRTPSRSREDYRRDRYDTNYDGEGDGDRFHNRGDVYYRGGNHRHYDGDRDANFKDYDRGDRRKDHPYQENDRYHRDEFENNSGRDRDYPHSSRPPRGHFHRGRGDGSAPYRGRGRGFPSRYIGDWELRDRDHPPQLPHGQHSNHHIPMPPPHPGPSHHPPPPEFFRGRGRGEFRGRGRGRGRGFHPYNNNSHPHPYHQNNNFDKYQRYDNNNGPVVHRDFTYLEELDRAYEKYFKSITTKNERSADDDDDRSRSPDH